MDPVSITCAVITLATALKDLIDLGIKMKELCDGVIHNNRELVRLASRIPPELEELDRLYQQNGDKMEQTPELREAIGTLKQKVETIYAKLQGLKLNNSRSWIFSVTKIKAYFKAPEVEKEIRSLKEDISNCHQSFQTFAAMRIEAGVGKVIATSQETRADVADIKAQLVRLTRERQIEITHMKVDVQQKLTVLSSDALAKEDTSRPTFRASRRSPTQDFIAHKVDDLAQAISQLAVEDRAALLKKPKRPFAFHIGRFHSFRRTPKQRDRSLLEETLRLLNSLEENSDAIDEHAYALTLLAEYFYSLDMKKEASMVSTWASNLYQILIEIYPKECTPYLLDARLCDSVYSTDSAHLREAVQVMRPFCYNSPSHDLQCQLAILLNNLATHLSNHAGLHEEAESVNSEALAIFETVLKQDPSVILDSLLSEVGLSKQVSAHPVGLHRKDFSFHQSTMTAGDFDLTGTDAYICGYGEALSRASDIEGKLGLHKKAKDYLSKAIICSRHLASAYPGTSLELSLACRLQVLASLDRCVMPVEEALGYVEEALCIHRRTYQYDPRIFTSSLFDCLSCKAEVLRQLGRIDEAHEALLEVFEYDTQLVNQIDVANSLSAVSSRLGEIGRREEAIVLRNRTVEIYCTFQKGTSFEEADQYLRLARDYQHLRQIDDGIRAADIAVQQFQALAFKIPLKHSSQLVQSLVTWIDLLTLSESYIADEALSRVRAILDHYDFLVQRDSTLFPVYYDIMHTLVNSLNNPTIAIALSEDIVERLRNLIQVHPEIVGMRFLEQLRYHGRRLVGSNRLKEAADWLEGLSNEYQSQATTDTEIGLWHLCLLFELAEVLKDQGDLERAKTVFRRVGETGRQRRNINVLFRVSLAVSHEAEIMAHLGDEVSALHYFVSHEFETLLLSQLQHSRLLAFHGTHNDALILAEGAAQRLLAYIAADYFQDDNDPYYWLSEFLCAWASCLSDTENLEQAMKVAEQGAKEARRVEEVNRKRLYLSTKLESYHGLALWTFGCIQLFSGDWNDALKSLEEARAIWQERVEVRRFDLRNLALTLWSLGFTYCLLGRHDDGASAHEELKKIINGLKYAEPTMHLVVTVALDQEHRRPSWVRFLESVREELQCGHLTMTHSL